MNLRPLVYMALFACIVAGLLAILSLFPKLLTPPSQQFLDFNDVRGSAISHNGKLFTLNFEQQNDLIKFLNSSVSNPTPALSDTPLPFQTIVIYLFDKPDINIMPVGYETGNLVFTTPNWNQGKPLVERSGGELKEILERTYD